MRHFLAVLAILTASVSVVSAQSGPQLEVVPSEAVAGDTVEVKGSGFLPGSIELFIDDITTNQLGKATVSRTGDFLIVFVVPDDPGSHRLIACRDRTVADKCAEQAFASFTIIRPGTTSTTTRPVSTTTTTTTTTTRPTTTTTRTRPTTTTTVPATSTTAPTSTAVFNSTTTTVGNLAGPTTTTTLGVSIASTTTTTEAGDLAVPSTTVGGDPGFDPTPDDFTVTTTTISQLSGGLPTGDIDLELTHIEITQGLQNLDNDFPLVADRPTAVRLFGIRSTDTATLASAFLEVSRNGEVIDILEAENNPVMFTDQLVRVSNDASPYFILDTDWIEDELTFRAVVIAGDPTLANDLTPANNFIETTVDFHDATPVSVHMYPLYVTEDGTSDGNGEVVTHTAADGWFQQAMSTYRIWPVGRMTFDPYNPVLGDSTSGWDFATEDALVNPWPELAVAATAHPGSHDLVMGMLSPLADSQWGGFAQGTSGNSWSRMTGWWHNTWPWHGPGGATIAQELGHNIGIAHAPCQYNPGDTEPGELHGGPIDPTFPQAYGWPNCSIAPSDIEGFYGFDVMYTVTGTAEPSIMSNRPSATPPANATPFMGYAATGKWVDPWHGCFILNWVNVPCQAESLIPIDDSVPGQGQGLPPVGSGGIPQFDCADPFTGIDLCNLKPLEPFDPTAYEPGDGQILVIGTLKLDTGTASLEPGPVIETGTPEIWLDNVADRDPYLLVLLDETGNVLSAQNLDNAKWSGHLGHDSQGHDETPDPPGELRTVRFGEMVPRADGVAKIVLVDNSGILATLEPGAAQPVIESFDARLTGATVQLTWSADDPDGDLIATAVQYETPDGWTTVATPGAAATSVAIDTSVLIGGRTAGFRLIASDGINQATSAPVDIVLADNAPQIAIASPIDQTSRAHGRLIEFWAFAHDPETEDTTVQWFSDRDGAFGEGERISVDTLSVGSHRITATATDSNGVSGSDSIVVQIGPPDGAGLATLDAIGELFAAGPPVRTSSDSFGSGTLALSLGALLVALAGALYYGRVRRQPHPT